MTHAPLPNADTLLSEAESLERQIVRLGGKLTYLSTPQSSGSRVLRHSTSIILDGNQVLVAQRAIQNRNGKLTVDWRDNPSTIIISRLSRDGLSTTDEIELSLLELTGQSLEDVRLMTVAPDEISLIGAVWDYRNWVENGIRAVTSQAILTLNRSGHINKIVYPNFGMNFSAKEYEKNWVPILDSSLMVYSLGPTLKIFDLQDNSSVESPGITWDYGEPHGGSQIIDVGPYKIGLFHSSMPIERRSVGSLSIASRTYFVGAFAMDTDNPHSLIAFSSEPLLTASLRDPMISNSTAVVLPHGLLFQDERLLISFGVNDAASALASLPISPILLHLGL